MSSQHVKISRGCSTPTNLTCWGFLCCSFTFEAIAPEGPYRDSGWDKKPQLCEGPRRRSQLKLPDTALTCCWSSCIRPLNEVDGVAVLNACCQCVLLLCCWGC